MNHFLLRLSCAFAFFLVFDLLGPSPRVFASPVPLSPGSLPLTLSAGDDDDDDGDAKKGSEKGAAKPGKASEKKPSEKPEKSTGEKAKKSPADTDDDDADDEKGEPAAEKATKPVKKLLSVDEQYVKDNLEKYLSPTKIEFMADGRVKLLFEFGERKEEHEGIFTPRVSKEINNKFRWSLQNEWGWGWGYSGSTRNKDGTYEYNWEGLRISNAGSAHLNCWFTDDVEAEISYVQAVSSSAKQTAAVVFTNTSGNSVGSNFGTQAATFSNGALAKRSGSIEAVPTDRGFKLKLVVRDGKFEAWRDGKSKQSMAYVKKTYESGRIGLLWGGGVASFIHRLEITGKIDAKKTAELMKKGTKK